MPAGAQAAPSGHGRRVWPSLVAGRVTEHQRERGSRRRQLRRRELRRWQSRRRELRRHERVHAARQQSRIAGVAGAFSGVAGTVSGVAGIVVGVARTGGRADGRGDGRGQPRVVGRLDQIRQKVPPELRQAAVPTVLDVTRGRRDRLDAARLL